MRSPGGHKHELAKKCEEWVLAAPPRPVAKAREAIDSEKLLPPFARINDLSLESSNSGQSK
jgi:hypothetical protein